MRTRFLVLGVSALFLTTGVAIVACGGDEESGPATSSADAGDENQGPTTTPSEAGTPKDSSTADTGTGCDTSKNFLEGIPDASIADGATTSGACLGCLQKSCNGALDKCNKDCNCREVVSEALACYLDGKGDILTCALNSDTSPSSSTQTLGLQIGGCVQNNCKEDCAFGEFDAGGL